MEIYSFQKTANNRQGTYQKLGQVQTTHWFESIRNVAENIYLFTIQMIFLAIESEAGYLRN